MSVLERRNRGGLDTGTVHSLKRAKYSGLKIQTQRTVTILISSSWAQLKARVSKWDLLNSERCRDFNFLGNESRKEFGL